MASFVLPPGTILKDRYCLQRLILEEGTVLEYMAQDIANGARYRVRQVHAVYTDPAASRRHRQNFRDTAPQLVGMHHRALAAVVDCFDEGPDFFTVSAWVEGPSLATIPVPVPSERALRWVVDVLDAMEMVASRSDRIGLPELSPQTIRVRDNGSIVIGCLRCLEDGTPAPANPSPFHPGDPHRSFKSDVYTLGALTWWLLTGQVPPSVAERRQADRQLAAPPGLPPRLSRALLSMMHLDPRRRPGSPAQARHLLVHGGAPAQVSDRRRPQRLNVPVVVGSVAVLAAVMLALVFPFVSSELGAFHQARLRRNARFLAAAARDCYRQGQYTTAADNLKTAAALAPGRMSQQDVLLLAEAQLADGQVVAARRTLDGMDRAHAGGDYWVVAGQVEEALGRPELARGAFRRAEAGLAHGSDAASLWRLGQAALAQGRYEDSVSALEKARNADPTLWQAGVDLAVAMRGQGRLDGARTLLKTVLEKTPDAFQASYELGQTCRQQGDLDAAQEAWRNALHLNVAGAPAWLAACQVDEATGQWQSALSCAWHAVHGAPRDPLAWVTLAHCLALNQMPPAQAQGRAERLLQQGLGRFPTATQSLAAGRLYLDEKRPADALPWLQRYTALCPDDVDGLALLGTCQAALGHAAEADQVREGLLAHRGEAAWAQYRAIQLQEAVGGWEPALSQWHRLTLSCPHEPAFDLGLGEALVHLRRYPEATRFLARACLTRTDCTQALMLLAQSEEELKHNELSALHLQKLCDLDGRAGWFELAGQRWIQAHRWDRALACYLVGERRHPEDPRFRYWLGTCFERVGRFWMAAYDYRQYLHRVPNGTFAEAARKRLSRLHPRVSALTR